MDLSYVEFGIVHYRFQGYQDRMVCVSRECIAKPESWMDSLTVATYTHIIYSKINVILNIQSHIYL